MKTITATSRPVDTPAAPPAPPAWSRHVDEAGLCWLTFDQPGSRVNLWSPTTLRGFASELDAIASDATIHALILRSGKPDHFIAGADLKQLRTLPPEALAELIRLGQDTFEKLAHLPLPTVALIHGACAGGGFEMALACDWRLASDHASTRIGLPEVQLGLLPGWGGTVRLPRVIGLRRALTTILGGKLHPALAARNLGLVDEVAPTEVLEDLALRYAGKHPPQPRRPWDTLPLISNLLLAVTRRRVMKQTRGLYPAPLKVLDVMAHTLHQDPQTALATERAGILDLATTPEAQHLIDLFFRRESAAKQPSSDAEPHPISDVVVIGAGVMGAGIAQTAGVRGRRVLLTDISDEALAAGMSKARQLTEKARRRHILTPLQARDTLDRLSGTRSRVPLMRYPLLIEAATEDLALKRRIFADAAQRVAPDAILATNTSALSIREIFADVPGLQRCIGLHFFNPVHRMPLVEVVVLPETDAVTRATAVAFVQALGKVSIVVGDHPGFIVNRILLPYLMEAVRLYESGLSARCIDQAMLDFGMPMGPLRLLDEIGLDIADHVATSLTSALPHHPAAPDTVKKWVAQGHLGRKTGQGFYRYTGSSNEVETRPSSSSERWPDSTDLQTALASCLSREAEHALADGVADSAEMIDLAMVLGAGYAPFRGGPLCFAREHASLLHPLHSNPTS
ncbi:MAG: enoyl-CoA hydratase/isomerase family protein [Verrucomicrobiales bacterium]|nr:enoyl-CoA hydratase/isomerase family protein [Verrucomicrobiales bacterium]